MKFADKTCHVSTSVDEKCYPALCITMMSFDIARYITTFIDVVRYEGVSVDLIRGEKSEAIYLYDASLHIFVYEVAKIYRFRDSVFFALLCQISSLLAGNKKCKPCIRFSSYKMEEICDDS